MEYVVTLPPDAPVTMLQDAIVREDPSACIDVDPASGGLRVATVLDFDSLAGVLRQSGLVLVEDDLEQKPSVCCGGCSG